MWLMVRHWPQSLEGDWARPHLYKLTWHGPWPVWKLFIRDHVWRGKSKPGYQIVGSVTTVWLTSDHRSRQPVLSPLRNRVNICRVWPYWVSRCKLWRWMLKDISIHRPIWMGFIGLKHTVSCCFMPQRRRWALLSTGSHQRCTGCRQPEIRHIELWCWVSMRFV